MLSIHPCLRLPSGRFLSGFPISNLYTFLFSPVRATFLADLILFDLIIRIMLGVNYKSRSSSLFSFLHTPTTSYTFGPSILLCTLFSDTRSVRDHVSKPYRTTGKIIALCILIFKFFDSRRESSRYYTKWWKALPQVHSTTWLYTATPAYVFMVYYLVS
jgi:uncharacterized membrane protein SirB2